MHIIYIFYLVLYDIMHKSKTVPYSRVGVCAYYGYKNTIYCIILYSKHTGWVWIVGTHKSCMSIYKYIDLLIMTGTVRVVWIRGMRGPHRVGGRPRMPARRGKIEFEMV